MTFRFAIRFHDSQGLAARWMLTVCLTAVVAVPARGQKAEPHPGPATAAVSAVVLDRVVAVVNNHPILASDVDNEIRLAALEPNRAGDGALPPRRALAHLISRTLIEEQIRNEEIGAIRPSQAKVDARLHELRQELPACVHFNCSSDAGWKAFLSAHKLTEPQVEAYLRSRIEILNFIELRFRQGILISPEEIETYYRKTLLPQYAAGEPVPPLAEVSPRISEILLEQQVNVLFDQWLQNLRKEGNVEVLDPALEVPPSRSSAEKGGA
ncbi:MAG: peptidylprolyl isomerase [Terracidiphilus sp.]